MFSLPYTTHIEINGVNTIFLLVNFKSWY